MTSNKVPTNEQITVEALRRRKERGHAGLFLTDFIIEVVREGWKPPEPVDPDMLAWREWMASRIPIDAGMYLSGKYDFGPTSTAYLAGARMAREQERVRARPLVEYLKDRRFEDAQADRLFAKYEEGGR